MLLTTTRPRVGSLTPADATLDLNFEKRHAVLLGKPVPIEQIVADLRSESRLTLSAGGIYEISPPSTLRFARNFDGAPRGLRVDPAAQNFALWSSDFTKAAWAKTAGASASISNTVTPDARTTGSILTDTQPIDSTPGTFAQAITIPDDASQWQVEFFVRPGSISELAVGFALLGGEVPIAAAATFDLQSGRVVIQNGVTGLIERAANGFFRIAAFANNNASGNVALFGSIARSSPSIAPGNFEVWGAGFYNSSGFRSPVLTEESSVLAPADSPVIPIALVGEGAWYRQSGGSWYLDVETDGGDQDWQFFLSKYNGSGDLMSVSRDGFTNKLELKGAVAAAPQVELLASGALGLGGRYRCALRYGASDFAFATKTDTESYTDSSDAGILTASTGTISASITNINIGADTLLSRQLQGVVRRMIYFPKKLSNQELADLLN